MGHNGKKASVFSRMVEFINDNAGKVVSSKEILLGGRPGKGIETEYLYKFIKLGYVGPVNDGFVTHPDTVYEIMRPFPPHYSYTMLAEEIREARGYVPDSHSHKIY